MNSGLNQELLRTIYSDLTKLSDSHLDDIITTLQDKRIQADQNHHLAFTPSEIQKLHRIILAEKNSRIAGKQIDASNKLASETLSLSKETLNLTKKTINLWWAAIGLGALSLVVAIISLLT